MPLKYFIKERSNPQSKEPYYVLKGQITAKEARKIEDDCIYGSNIMLPYNNSTDYEIAIQKLREAGKKIVDF